MRLQLILACLQVCLPGEPGLAAIGIRVRDNGDSSTTQVGMQKRPNPPRRGTRGWPACLGLGGWAEGGWKNEWLMNIPWRRNGNSPA